MSEETVVVGRIDGCLADKIGAEVYIRIGSYGSWVRAPHDSIHRFRPLSREEANEPKFQRGLKKIGGPYESAH